MSPRFERLLADIGTIALIAGGLFVLTHPEVLPFPPRPPEAIVASIAGTSSEGDAPVEAPAEEVSEEAPPGAEETAPIAEKKAVPVVKQEPQKPAGDETSDTAHRIEDPYSTPPQSFERTNEEARRALVNIMCVPTDGGFRPITASGVLIDPRGVVLTNAHVAQYVLLAESGRVNISCGIRTGSPAKLRFGVEVLYIPPVWVEKHANDITSDHPLGTGEHDYALLRITNSVNSEPFPARFPFIPYDARDGIGFVDDDVLAASYPAEFLGGYSAQLNLYAVTTVASIRELLTFGSGTVDMFSIGGVIGAQSGSSGGPVLNAWGRLIGIITTTSEAKTTGERDLRAIALSYIDRDLTLQRGDSLVHLLEGDVGLKAFDFNSTTAPTLVELLLKAIEG
jgi:S1-C subfamily serine protease